MGKHLARATQEPGVVREIDDAELLDLARQGLLYSYEHTDAAAAVLGGAVKTPGKWKGPDRGDDVVTAPPATRRARASRVPADEKGE